MVQLKAARLQKPLISERRGYYWPYTEPTAAHVACNHYNGSPTMQNMNWPAVLEGDLLCNWLLKLLTMFYMESSRQ